MLEHGAAFGPLVAGPDGVTFLETYTGDVTPVPVDKEGYQRLLEERGIVRLPNPEFDRPDERARQRPRRRRPLVLTVSASELRSATPLRTPKPGTRRVTRRSRSASRRAAVAR